MKRVLLSDIVLQNAILKNIIKNTRINLLFFNTCEDIRICFICRFQENDGNKKGGIYREMPPF